MDHRRRTDLVLSDGVYPASAEGFNSQENGVFIVFPTYGLLWWPYKRRGAFWVQSLNLKTAEHHPRKVFLAAVRESKHCLRRRLSDTVCYKTLLIIRQFFARRVYS